MKNIPVVEEKTRFTGVSALAKKCGVAPSTISMILHGNIKPGKALARKLARCGVIPPPPRTESNVGF